MAGFGKMAVRLMRDIGLGLFLWICWIVSGSAGECLPLFAAEDWYLRQTGQEQSFSGRLQAPPATAGFSTVQRNSIYQIGETSLYSGAKRLPMLDSLLGREVVVEGKFVVFTLEGQTIREIWPACIRAEDGH
jgi:hypothetical protein